MRRTALRRTAALAGAVAGGGPLANDEWGELWTDGGIVASAPDVARFFDALVGRRRVLRPGTLRRMLTSGPDGSYGLGIARLALGDCQPWGHGGAWADWSTMVLSEPRSQTTVAVLLRGAPARGAEPVSLAIARELELGRVLPC